MATKKISGLWLVFFGAVFWSINAPIVKSIQLDPLLLCALRSGTAGLVLLPFLRPRRLRWNRWMLIYILAYTALSLAIIVSLKMTSATIAVGMQYTGPIWLFLVGLLRKEKFTWSTFIPVSLITLGVLLFMLGGGEDANTVGNLIALTEGISFAIMSVSVKKVGGDNPLGISAIGNLTTALLIFCFLPPTFQQILTVPAGQWLPVLVLGVVQIGCGYACYNTGIRTVTAQQASIMALWEMVLGPLWVALFLHQYPSVSAFIGLIVILLGLGFNIYLSSRSSRWSPPTGQIKHKPLES